MPVITQSLLKSVLHYDPDTGFFVWLVALSKRTRVGSIAGCDNTNGYIVIRLFGDLHYAHRLAYLYMTGASPSDKIDHKNTINNDNRWKNLRDADDFTNNQNLQKAKKHNSTGLLGVSPHGVRFRARIRLHGKGVLLGVFDTPELAHSAYISAKRKNHAGCLL